MPKVSIGMPLYNAEKYVAEALDSLLKQTFEDYEIIISDNCSTDRTMEIVEKYSRADERIRIIQQDTNIGPVPNFKAVVDEAKGEYFLWRSYDDWSDDNYVEKLAKDLDKNPEIDLAFTKLVQVSEDGQHKSAPLDWPKIQTTGISSKLTLMKYSHPSWMYGMFRRSAVKASIERVVKDFNFVWGWDHLVLCPIVASGRAAFNSETHFYQRITSVSDSSFRPRTAKSQFMLAWNFYQVCLTAIRSQKMGLGMCLIMPFFLLRYTSMKTEKFSRILRIFLGLKKL